MTRTWLVALALAVGSPAVAGGENPRLVSMLHLVDPVADGNRFGNFLSIDAGRVLVGAPATAYRNNVPVGLTTLSIFDLQTGTMIRKLSSAENTGSDSFGGSAAVDGSLLVVGAPGRSDVGLQSGAAYLFDLSTGQETAKLSAPRPDWGDHFGVSTAIVGNRIIVSAPDYHTGVRGFGGTFVYTLTGQYLQTIDPPYSQDAYFGSAMGGSSSGLVIGSPHSGQTETGAAYVYDVGDGRFLRQLVPTPNSGRVSLGWSVAVEGNRALVGAPNDGDGGEPGGSAYLFDINTGQQLARFRPSDPSTHGMFGRSVAIDGDYAVVGAVNWDTWMGSAYVFRISTGEQLAKLSSPTSRDQFGLQVAAYEDRFAVAAPYTELPGGTGWDGAVYVYEVPEPATMNIAAAAALVLVFLKRRRHPAIPAAQLPDARKPLA